MEGVIFGDGELFLVVVLEVCLDIDEVLVGYVNFIGVIGMWLGELYVVLVVFIEDLNFGVCIVDVDDVVYWIVCVSEQFICVYDNLLIW